MWVQLDLKGVLLMLNLNSSNKKGNEAQSLLRKSSDLPSLLMSSPLLCRWMEACLGEDLPPTTELEEGLRNGVYLAKLGNFFSPKVVSLKKIYDREQTRYRVSPSSLGALISINLGEKVSGLYPV